LGIRCGKKIKKLSDGRRQSVLTEFFFSIANKLKLFIHNLDGGDDDDEEEKERDELAKLNAHGLF
jgi:hypothetical protein